VRFCMKNKVSVFWFRRDLRLEDNMGLYHALSSSYPVFPLFIFDSTILDVLDDKTDRRVDYIHQALTSINLQLGAYGAKLTTFYGKPLEVFQKLCERFDIQEVFCNRDYEPQAIKRDTKIYTYLKEHNIPFKAYKDQVIFDRKDILKNDGTPYTVYTPYSKKWKEFVTPSHYEAHVPDFSRFMKQPFEEIHTLEEIGFIKTTFAFDEPQLDARIIEHYDKYRDFPAMQ